MEPGAILWEHRDYQELTTVLRYRFQVSLATNPDAFLVFGNEKVHLPANGISTCVRCDLTVLAIWAWNRGFI